MMNVCLVHRLLDFFGGGSFRNHLETASHLFGVKTNPAVSQLQKHKKKKVRILKKNPRLQFKVLEQVY